MQEKIIIRFCKVVILLSLSQVAYSAPAYMPHEVREMIKKAYEVADGNIKKLQELDSIIHQNRILAPEELVREALSQAYRVTASRSNKNRLQEYMDSLGENWILLSMNRKWDDRRSFSISSIEADSSSLEVMQLSTELTERENIAFCGNLAPRKKAARKGVERTIRPNSVSDPSVIFVPNMMTSQGFVNPPVVFGTGVNAAVINAWPMAPGFVDQAPVVMQLPMPGNIRERNAISLELHFLIKQEGDSRGLARIRISSKFIQSNTQFDLFDMPPTFDHILNTSDFVVLEPTNPDNVKHIRLIVPLENEDVRRGALAIISVKRVDPVGSEGEYTGNLYLAAAAFKYTDQ